MIRVGYTYEIQPAYSMDNGPRSLYDDVTGCMCEVVQVLREGDVEVQIQNVYDTVILPASRLAQKKY